jgi:hypothetical protein
MLPSVKLGKLPGAVLEMLQHFNGARLFDAGAGGEMVKVFGISEKPPLPKFEWAPVWNIDKFTPGWRAAGDNRKNDWPIAMMTYGELILLTGQNNIKKWDTALGQFAPGTMSLGKWLQELFDEGEEYLKEVEQDAQK